MEKINGQGWYRAGTTWIKSCLARSELKDMERVVGLSKRYGISTARAMMALKAWGYSCSKNTWYAPGVGKIVPRKKPHTGLIKAIAICDPDRSWKGTVTQAKADMWLAGHNMWVFDSMKAYYGQPVEIRKTYVFNVKTRDEARVILREKPKQQMSGEEYRKDALEKRHIRIYTKWKQNNAKGE